jgi:undecaprenyl-diphosphatase
LPSDATRARIAAFDDAVDRAVTRIRSPRLDGLVYRLSSAADHSLLWHFCAVGRSLVHDGDLGYALRFGAAMSVESVLTNGVIKSFFQRHRPADFADVDFSYGLRRPLTSSFPSGHAAAGFCAATLLGGGPWYLAAAAVAGTRVYVRLHHASDVAAGAALGLALGLVMKRFVGE